MRSKHKVGREPFTGEVNQTQGITCGTIHHVIMMIAGKFKAGGVMDPGHSMKILIPLDIFFYACRHTEAISQTSLKVYPCENSSTLVDELAFDHACQ
jgi:hypothetical protein